LGACWAIYLVIGCLILADITTGIMVLKEEENCLMISESFLYSEGMVLLNAYSWFLAFDKDAKPCPMA
jgi:hypothetical protein